MGRITIKWGWASRLRLLRIYKIRDTRCNICENYTAAFVYILCPCVSPQKQGGVASLMQATVFSPSVCQTSAAGWGSERPGDAGSRSSWEAPSFPYMYIAKAQERPGGDAGYCQYMRRAPRLRKYSQKTAISIDIFFVLWYSITIPLPKGDSLCRSPKTTPSFR